MYLLEHIKCPVGTHLLGIQRMSCLKYRERAAWNTRDVLLGPGNVVPGTYGMSSRRATKIYLRCPCPMVIDFTSRLISYSHVYTCWCVDVPKYRHVDAPTHWRVDVAMTRQCVHALTHQRIFQCIDPSNKVYASTRGCEVSNQVPLVETNGRGVLWQCSFKTFENVSTQELFQKFS